VANWTEFRPTQLLRALVARGVDFVVVGGVAMIGHGSTRPTYDVDICYATDPANLEALADAMVELGAKLRGIHEEVPFVPDARTLRQTSVLTLTTPEGEIDLLVGPAGAPAYAELRDRARRITVDGVAVLIASLDDLESMKRAAGRPKDLLDLEEIAAIRRLRRQLGRD
jgi:predicted nucleotidyltransferase